jgi:hypothetical protein
MPRSQRRGEIKATRKVGEVGSTSGLRSRIITVIVLFQLVNWRLYCVKESNHNCECSVVTCKFYFYVESALESPGVFFVGPSTHPKISLHLKIRGVKQILI